MDDLYLDIPQAVTHAIAVRGLQPSQIRLADQGTAREVAEQIKRSFLKSDCDVWWHCFGSIHSFADYPECDGWKYLADHVPDPHAHYWFIPEPEAEVMVYSATVEAVQEVVQECIAFEYYLVSQEFQWIVVENDHNQVVVARSLAG